MRTEVDVISSRMFYLRNYRQLFDYYRSEFVVHILPLRSYHSFYIGQVCSLYYASIFVLVMMRLIIDGFVIDDFMCAC